MLRNKRGRNSERPAHRDEEWPPLAATRESPSTETKTQHSNQSINKINKSFKKTKQNKKKTLPLCILFLNHVTVLSLCDRLHYWSQFFILPVATPLLWPHCGWNVLSHPLTGLGRVTCFHQGYMGRNDRKPVACQKSENTTKPQEPSHYGVGSNS